MKRLTQIPFPPYCYIPGQNPHPRRSSEGYLYGKTVLQPDPLDDANWRDHVDYHYAIDLWNFGYDWQFHEALEPIWVQMNRHSPQAWFLQGLIQLAACRLKLKMRQLEPAQDLYDEAKLKLRRLNSPHWGIDQKALLAGMKASLEAGIEQEVQIHFPCSPA